jgi:Domain of unknown function (DUF3387)
MPQKNLAVELLRKLLAGEIKTRARRNVVQGRWFAELLDQSLRRSSRRRRPGRCWSRRRRCRWSGRWREPSPECLSPRADRRACRLSDLFSMCTR